MIRFAVDDTLCGWCFVALPELEAFAKALPPEVPLEVRHRRLFYGAHAPSISPGFIALAERVGKEVGPAKTGARMSEAHYDFLRLPGLVYDSGLMALGFNAVKSLSGGHLFAFVGVLQRLIFEEGADFREEATLTSATHAIGLDKDLFLAKLHAPDNACNTEAEAELVAKMMQDLGSNGVPTLVLSLGRERVLLDPYDAASALEVVRARC